MKIIIILIDEKSKVKCPQCGWARTYYAGTSCGVFCSKCDNTGFITKEKFLTDKLESSGEKYLTHSIL